MIRTVGSSRSGQSGSVSVNCTACGRISAAGLEMSNGKAPKMIGALCDASAARASASRGNAVCTPSATTTPVRPASTKTGSRVTSTWTGWAVPVSPSALSWRTPCSKPHTAIDAAAIANLIPSETGCSTQRVITAREKWPCPTNTTSRDSMCSNASAIDRSARSQTCCRRLTAGTTVRPHQPVGHRLADLFGGRALVVAVIPFGLICATTSSTVRPASSAVTCARSRGLLTTKGSVSLSTVECVGGRFACSRPVLGEVQFGPARCVGRTSTTRSRRDEEGRRRCCRQAHAH